MSIRKTLIVKFAEGIVYGLGLVTGFAIILPLLLWILGQFDWVPFISDFLLDVIERMNEANPAVM